MRNLKENYRVKLEESVRLLSLSLGEIRRIAIDASEMLPHDTRR
jgi:hypothetical protein